MADSYALKKHKCFVNFRIPSIPALSKAGSFFACPRVNPIKYRFTDRKFKIYTHRFDNKGSWDICIFKNEPGKHVSPRFDIKFLNRCDRKSRDKCTFHTLTAKPIVWLDKN